MNLIDCYVTKILDKPYEKCGTIWLKVEYESWGITSTGYLLLDNFEEAAMIRVGHCFQQ